jgi:O-antigen/teichoic acid export membrane protein
MRLSRSIAFDSEHFSHDLASKSVRSGLIAITSQGIQLLLSMAGTIILARLLTPNDYGLVGMVTVILGFARMFVNAGLSMATIQTEHISHEQISTLFWVNLAISVFFGLCILVCAPLVAIFYGRQELTLITASLSLTFVITGLTIQHQALLNRNMYFGALACIQIISQVIVLVVTVTMAWLGWRYWALVAGSFVSELSAALLTFFFCPWIPGLMQRGFGVRGMLKFGGHLTVSNIANYLSSNMDNVLIGRYIGAGALGLYARAYQLFMMPITYIRGPIVNVTLPVLCSLRNQPERFLTYYQRIVDILSTITIPMSLYCVAESDFLIKSFLGPQWIAAVPAFRILALAAVMYPLNGMQALVTMSMGFSVRFLYWGLSNAFLYVAGFIIGLPFGIEGVATGFAVATCIVGLTSMMYCFRNTPVSASQFVTVQIFPFLVSILAIGSLLLAKHTWGDNSMSKPLARLGIFLVIYIGVSCCRKSNRKIIWLALKDLSMLSGKLRVWAWIPKSLFRWGK